MIKIYLGKEEVKGGMIFVVNLRIRESVNTKATAVSAEWLTKQD